MIKLMMILSLFAIPLHAYGAGDHETKSGDRTYQTKPNEREFETVETEVDTDLTQALLHKYYEATDAVQCVKTGADCEKGGKKVGELADTDKL